MFTSRNKEKDNMPLAPYIDSTADGAIETPTVIPVVTTTYNTNNSNNSNSSNNRRAMIDPDRKKMICRSSTVTCVLLVIVSIALIAVSFKKLEENQFGLLYDVWRKDLDDEAQSGGLFSGPPGFKFVKFPSTFVTIELNDRYCVSRDGLIVGFSVTFQYQMIAENMFPAVERYRDFGKWDMVVYEAGLSAVHHSCSDFFISNFQNKRGEIQAVMEDNLRVKLEGNSTQGTEGVYAMAISLQLRNIQLPEEYSNAVKDKQSAEEDIALAQNQRQQETTRAGTDLLKAKEEARKILDTANNDVEILLTEARLSAEETTFAFAQEAQTIVDVKEALGLSTDGVLAYLANGLLADIDNLSVTTGEPARLSRSQDLSMVSAGGGGVGEL